MPVVGPPLGGRERTAFIMSRISHLIGEAVLQAEVRKMPRNWNDAIPQLGDFTYPDFLERHKGQILDEYLRYYCKYWGNTQAGPMWRGDITLRGGGLRLFDCKEMLVDLAMTCVRDREPLSSWTKILDYFLHMGDDKEELEKRKYFILDCFLAQWADAVSKDFFRMQIFLPSSPASVHGTRDLVYVSADIDIYEPRISRRHVENMGLQREVHDDRVTLECRLLGTQHMGEMVRMTFKVMDTEEAMDMFRDGVCISSNMEHWRIRRRNIDVEELEIEET